ncbi:MAG: hypothetical protein ACOYK9_05480 [Chlamydiia bacterium]
MNRYFFCLAVFACLDLSAWITAQDATGFVEDLNATEVGAQEIHLLSSGLIQVTLTDQNAIELAEPKRITTITGGGWIIDAGNRYFNFIDGGGVPLIFVGANDCGTITLKGTIDLKSQNSIQFYGNSVDFQPTAYLSQGSAIEIYVSDGIKFSPILNMSGGILNFWETIDSRMELNVLPLGMTLGVDQGVTRMLGGRISGSGAIRKVLTGGFSIEFPTEFTGTMYVDNGTLILSGAGSLENCAAIVLSDEGSLDLHGVTPPINGSAEVLLKHLSGTGTVVLGDHNLHVEKLDFSGTVIGTGSIYPHPLFLENQIYP